MISRQRKGELNMTVHYDPSKSREVKNVIAALCYYCRHEFTVSTVWRPDYGSYECVARIRMKNIIVFSQSNLADSEEKAETGCLNELIFNIYTYCVNHAFDQIQECKKTIQNHESY